MAQEASYLVTKDGARGILVSERVGEKLHIKALVASPQKQGIGRLLVETFAAKLPGCQFSAYYICLQYVAGGLCSLPSECWHGCQVVQDA